MRLGVKSQDPFISNLNEIYTNSQNKLLTKMTSLLKLNSVNVMLADGTIQLQKTFEPEKIKDFFSKIISELNDWSSQGLSTSQNEDVRRIFFRAESRQGNYLLTLHLSLQYHVLLFYKPDNVVMTKQKQLSDIIEKTKSSEEEFAKRGDSITLQKLKQNGHENLDPQKLFETFYENEKLIDEIYDEIEDKTDADFVSMNKKKQSLLQDLDNLLFETFQTSTVLIDETRLLSGEEGIVFTIDVEFLKNNLKEGLFDPRRIPESVKNSISEKIRQVVTLFDS